MNKLITLIVVIVVLIGGWFILRHHDSDDAMMQDVGATTAPEATTSSPTMPDGAVFEDGVIPSTSTSTSATTKTFTVTGSNFAFAPKTLTVNKGDTVTIVFKNSGGFHDFKIDEFHVATKQIQDGASETVTFVADKAGTFEYYCSVGNHRAMGMVGTLTVK